MAAMLSSHTTLAIVAIYLLTLATILAFNHGAHKHDNDD